MSGAIRVVGEADDEQDAWTLALSLDRYDQRGELTETELHALGELGPKALGRNGARGIPRRTAARWRTLARLVEPLDAARPACTHGEDIQFRRAGAHAAAIILQRCADTARSYWAWPATDWADLCGASAETFVAAQPLPTETTVPPFLIALATCSVASTTSSSSARSTGCT